jgi:hypothetical protein
VYSSIAYAIERAARLSLHRPLCLAKGPLRDGVSASDAALARGTLLRMKPDLYTKVVLTIIALALVLIACNHYSQPAVTAQAEGPFAGVQFSGDSRGFVLFDSRTGDIWQYYSNVGMGTPSMDHTRISGPGVPVSAVQWWKHPE